MLGAFFSKLAVWITAGMLDISSTQDISSMHRRQLQQNAECDDSRRWAQLPWAYLSYAEARSWTILGWTPQVWDEAHPIPTTTAALVTTTFGRRLRAYDMHSFDVGNVDTWKQHSNASRRLQVVSVDVPVTETMCYADLSEAQQDAVRTLGYTIGGWHQCKSPSCKWPTDVPEPSASCLDTATWLEGLYVREWTNLTTAKRDALEILGWSPQRWSAGEYPLVYANFWVNLLPRQQEAARFLGSTPDTWEKCQKAAPCIERLEIQEARLDPRQFPWENLAGPFRNRLMELGYDSRRWQNGDSPTLNKKYSELLPHEIVSVRLSGWVSDTWDGCLLAQCSERFTYVKRKYHKMWNLMTVAQRRAWMLLGHTEQKWQAGGMMNTATSMLRWDELSNEQQQQARFLGHSEGSWNQCSSTWGRPETTQAPSVPGPSSNQLSRTVRARMTIRRPFSEVSGNVYGSAVAKVPTSFIQTFEDAIARSLFCGNPPLSENPQTYIDSAGGPLCTLQSDYVKQRHRVKVLKVAEGSIIVDFFLSRNQTASETPAVVLFQSITRFLNSPQSLLCQDMNFGKFARVAVLAEVPLSHLSEDEMQQTSSFERMRANWPEHRACELLSDARDDPVNCQKTRASFARRAVSSLAAASLFLLACL